MGGEVRKKRLRPESKKTNKKREGGKEKDTAEAATR